MSPPHGDVLVAACSDRRGSSGQRRIAGSVLLRLAALPPSGYSRLSAWVRMCYSYVITPHTLELHTSGVLSCLSRDEFDGCHAALVQEWLVGQTQHALPPSLVGQVGAGTNVDKELESNNGRE